jgi:cytochrome b
MNKINIYDWPVRIFHWIFAFAFVGAFSIAQIFEDDSAQYPYHMMIGMTLALAVLLRVIWGVVGTKYARFSSFALKPKELISYFKTILKRDSKKYTGHNPASSWAAIVMMICALGLATSGYFMVHGKKEALEDIHEILANLFLVSAIAHVLGVIFFTVKHKEAIGLSMIDGKKLSSTNNADAGIKNNYISVGIVFLLLVVFFGGNVLRNYDSSTRSLHLFGQTHKLGKIKKE